MIQLAIAMQYERRRSPRKSPRYCLLCSARCSKGHSMRGTNMSDLGVEILGGQNCTSLVNQLEQTFILLKILDIPKEWYGEMLSKQYHDIFGEHELGSGLSCDSDLDESWFDVCHDCATNSVMEAWKIHQQMIKIQVKMLSVKKKVKEKMRHGIENFMNYKSNGYKNGTIEYEIRKLLFPDLFMKTEVAQTLNDDFAYYMDNEIESPSHEIMNVEVEKNEGDMNLLDARLEHGKKIMKRTYKEESDNIKKRRRTRAPGRVRPLKTHSNVYRTRFYGVLKRSQFQWKVCPNCSSRYKTQEEYDAHCQAHEKGATEFTCSECTYPAQSAEELEIHNLRHKARLVEKHQRRKRYPCPKCSLKTRNWKHLKLHVEQNHPNLSQDEMETAGLILKCSLCGGKEFDNMTTFVIHQNRMHPKIEAVKKDGDLQCLTCPDCGVKFVTSTHLESHIRNTHRRDSKFVCEECGVGFPFQSKLDKHKRKHLDQGQKKQFICHLCGLDYVNESLLKQHQKKFHSNSPYDTSSGKVFKCRYCPLTSHIPAIIKRHLETHKEQMGNRCDECGKYYTSQQALDRHIKNNHSGESWPCPYCLKTYPCEQYMKDHMKKNCKLKGLKQD